MYNELLEFFQKNSIEYVSMNNTYDVNKITSSQKEKQNDSEYIFKDINDKETFINWYNNLHIC